MRTAIPALFRGGMIAIPALMLAVAALLPPSGASAEPAGFSISRGVNIAQWFTWPRYSGDGYGIAWPPYKSTHRPPSDAEFKALRAAGFDSVRLPVDPAPFIVFKGRRREAVYDMLFAALDRINAAGLKVIVDIHPNSRHPRWGQDAVAAGLTAPAFAAIADVIEELARRLAPAQQSWVALELLNEPRLKCKGPERAVWQSMAEHLVQRARAANAGLSLIVSGACVSSVDGLLALDPKPFHDPGIFYTFHFYEPFSFSHQGAQFIPWPDKYLDGVPWPSSARPIAVAQKLLEGRLASLPGLAPDARDQARRGALNNLERFYASKAGSGTIKARFAALEGWADRHGIPRNHILNGEFGAIRRSPGTPGAFCADRLRWLRDVREASEASGFAWVYFNYDGPFALTVGDGDRRLDQGVLSSLGMAFTCVPSAAGSPVPRAMCCPAQAD